MFFFRNASIYKKIGIFLAFLGIFLLEDRDMKQVIRLTEGDLHKIVKESVKKILKEYNFDAVRSVETKLKMAAAKAQYGRDDEASRMIEEASELVEQYNDKLIQALGEDECEQLVKILDVMVRPMPVDGKILLRLITKALAIIKNGYKTDDKIEFGGI